MAKVNTDGATKAVPSPPRTGLIGGHLPGLKALGPLDFFHESHREYGGIVRFRFLVFRVYLLTEPAYVEHVLKDNHVNYDKNLLDYKLIGRVLGNGLLTSDGAFWLRQRRLAQPAFARKRIEQYAGAMTAAAEELAERWRGITDSDYASARAAVDVEQDMARMTFRIAGETLMSMSLGNASEVFREAFDKVNELLIRRMESVVPAFIPMPLDGELRAAAKTLQDMVMGLIAERRAALQAGGGDSHDHVPADLMSRLVQARDPETGAVMDDEQLRDELLTLLVAGHETTANALTWTFYLLARNPRAREKLEAELDALPQDRPVALEDLEGLSYTRMVFQEAMRLYPPVWSVARRAAGDDVIDGYPVPKGSIILMPMWVVHRHKTYWDAPEEFRPERFAPEAEAKRPKYAYYPFGGGPRLCIGRDFAMMEGVLTLAVLAREFRLDPEHPEQEVKPRARVTLGPEGGMPMRLTRRRGSTKR